MLINSVPVFQAFSDVHIEDMWLPFFCNSTNINSSSMAIHETGYAWRYIRKHLLCIFTFEKLISHSGASMTLVGLLPPISDNGQMLVDGGYSKFL